MGEVGDSQRGLEIVGEYTSGGDKMQMCYAFEFLAPDALTPERVVEVQNAFATAAPEGWACWAFSNHDVVRHVSRWGAEVMEREAYAKLLASILLTQRGSVCIYQGEELGLTEADIAFADLQDPYGIQFWPEFKGRDGCRTPMVWDDHAQQAGFSHAEKTWLPIPLSTSCAPSMFSKAMSPRCWSITAASLLSANSTRLSPRARSSFCPWMASAALPRKLGNEVVLCLFNMGPEAASTEMPDGTWTLLDGHGFESTLKGRVVELPAWGACFARHA